MSDLVTVIGIVAALAVTYGKAFGGYQESISQAVIDACAIRSRYRRITNLGVGIAIATGFTVVGALWIGQWGIVPAGVLAGILAAVEAGKAHDASERQSEA